MGYFGYAYYAANKERLRAVAVQAGADGKPILPSPETIADKSYTPLSRPLFIYVKNSAARRPEIKQFLKYYLENVQQLAVKGGYDPPTAAELKENEDALAKLYPRAETAGTAPAEVLSIVLGKQVIEPRRTGSHRLLPGSKISRCDLENRDYVQPRATRRRCGGDR